MQITKEQTEYWSGNPETAQFEAAIGPTYKKRDGSIDIEALFLVAGINGLHDVRVRYGHLNVGQIAMNIRNRLRPFWRTGTLKLPN